MLSVEIVSGFGLGMDLLGDASFVVFGTGVSTTGTERPRASGASDVSDVSETSELAEVLLLAFVIVAFLCWSCIFCVSSASVGFVVPILRVDFLKSLLRECCDVEVLRLLWLSDLGTGGGRNLRFSEGEVSLGKEGGLAGGGESGGDFIFSLSVDTDFERDGFDFRFSGSDSDGESATVADVFLIGFPVLVRINPANAPFNVATSFSSPISLVDS